MLSLYIVVYCLIINLAACSSVVVQPVPVSVSVPEYAVVSEPVPPSVSSLEPAVEAEPVPTTHDASPPLVSAPVTAPTISSISQSPAQNGAHTITLKGSGLDNGAIIEIYSASGKYIGKGILSGKPHSNQMTVKLMKGLESGKYTVKVKTQDGRFSNTTTLTIPKITKAVQQVPQTPQCTGHFSKKPSVLYLCGGDAEKLLESYLAQNSGFEKLPYSLKIKFYEKEKDKTDLILQSIELGDMEQLFVESQKDFLEKMKKRLKGRVAELSTTLPDDASRENADYFQCP